VQSNVSGNTTRAVNKTANMTKISKA
jgi:hypothetical protein